MLFYIFVRFAVGREQLPRRFLLIYRKKSAPGRYAWPPRIHLPNLACDAREVCEARDAPKVCEDPALFDAAELRKDGHVDKKTGKVLTDFAVSANLVNIAF